LSEKMFQAAVPSNLFWKLV